MGPQLFTIFMHAPSGFLQRTCIMFNDNAKLLLEFSASTWADGLDFICSAPKCMHIHVNKTNIKAVSLQRISEYRGSIPQTQTIRGIRIMLEESLSSALQASVVVEKAFRMFISSYDLQTSFPQEYNSLSHGI